MELMNYSSGLSKQKHRSVYSCSSRADHTILFHLSMYSLQRWFQISFAAGSAVMRGSVQGFGFGFPDIEEQSMLAAKTGAKAKTVSIIILKSN